MTDPAAQDRRPHDPFAPPPPPSLVGAVSPPATDPDADLDGGADPALTGGTDTEPVPGPTPTDPQPAPEPDAEPAPEPSDDGASGNDGLDTLLKADLVALAEQRGLSTAGTKAELIERLRAVGATADELQA
jgi:hypothetical protein